MTFDVSTGISLGALALIAAALWAVWKAVADKLTQEQTWREEADDEERKAREVLALNDQNGRLIIQRELADFKLYVAQTYVSSISLRETEERLIASNDRLSDSLDKIVNRLDKLSIEMARAGIGDVDLAHERGKTPRRS